MAMAATTRPTTPPETPNPDRPPSERTMPEPQPETVSPAEWTRRLAPYRGSDPARSLFELAVTAVPFLAAFGLAGAALAISPWLALLLTPLAAAFVVRLFMIQHDCGHGAFFRSRALNDWLGRVLGVLTLTPYDVWRRTHAIHHASTGNLDRRGTGDLPMLTVAEYCAKPWHMRALYRLVRHPLFLFGVVPFYSFFLQNRFPAGLWRGGWRYWLSALATDAAILVLVAALWVLGGWELVVFVYLPVMLLSASAGMWLFYVQHQFEETWWEREADWQVHDAALHGSSYYVLPPVLNWLTANIGMHHVHHLASRIPFYRLGEALRDHDALARVQRLTLGESLRCARLHLWDERKRRLVSFAEAREAPG